MTQEEKAKRYDETLEQLRGLIEGTREDKCAIVEEDIIHIFPERKESEDERIRKEIISALKNANYKGVYDKHLAWLEKQGNNINCIYDKELSELLHIVICRYINDPDISYSERENVSKKILPYVELLEKQGEQKSIDNLTQQEAMDIAVAKCFNEQKTADKIEPKFQHGQWIVWQNKCYKVNYNGCGYELIDQNGLSTSLEYGTIDENAHLWDITKDAKEGDVLMSRSPFIYGKQCPYGGLNWYNNNFIKASIFIFTDSPVHPATKEQHDILFQKMKESGYEWDVEKKELKKIEQKPADKEETKFKVGDEIKTANEEPLTITKIDEKGYWSEDLFICGFGDAAKWELVGKSISKIDPKFHEGDWVVVSTIKGDRVVQIASVEYLKDGYPSYITTEGRWFGNGTKARLLTDKDVEIATIPESKIVVSKSKYWSEEDEDTLAAIIAIIRKQYNGTNIEEKKYYNVLINWLKSLKDRVYPKQEWKQENTDDLYKLKML